MAIKLQDNILVGAGKPLDSKYLNSSNQPYADTTAVNAAIVQSQRHIGLIVNVNYVEYWYHTGTTDPDLIAIESPGSLSGITLADNGLTKVGSTVILGGDLTGDTCVTTSSHALSLFVY